MTNDKPYLILTAADKAIMESYAAMAVSYTHLTLPTIYSV